MNDKRMVASLKYRNVKQRVWAATATQPPTIAVKRGLNISGNDVWLMFSNTGDASVMDVRRASEAL